MAIFIAIVAIAAAVGLTSVKIDEGSGLECSVFPDKLTQAHGKLTSVKITSPLPKESPLRNRIAKSFPAITTAIFIVASIAVICANIDQAASIAVSGIPALAIAGEACLRASEARITFWTYLYALASGVILAAVGWMPIDALFSPDFQNRAVVIAYAVITDMLFAIGSCACVAFLPEVATFERTFEDGAKRSITVSTRSRAYAEYLAMMGKTSKED